MKQEEFLVEYDEITDVAIDALTVCSNSLTKVNEDLKVCEETIKQCLIEEYYEKR